jgi:5-methyltetrahydrofolate--homocysteine methyltransferase
MSSKIPFLDLIKNRTVLFDGAMGTSLIANGMAAGESPEEWNLSHPDVIAGVHQAYGQAGADVLQTNTLGGSRLKLSASRLGDQAEKINVQSVRLARQFCPQHCYLAGDIGPTGQFLPPVGNTNPEEMEATFREQAEYLAGEGVDLFIIETFYDLQEILLAIKAVRSITPLPVVATLSFERKLKGFATIMGNKVPDCARQMASAGADVVGTNCNLGSADMVDFTPLWRQATELPILIQPNAGQPQVVDGQLTYQQKPEAFAQDIVGIVKAGADAVGGCCGTTPEFLALIHDRLKEEGLLEDKQRDE